MYKISEFKDDLDNRQAEITFDMDDGHYYISNIVSVANGGVFIYGPHNEESVKTSDDVLDKLLVMGKPMREMMDQIDPD